MAFGIGVNGSHAGVVTFSSGKWSIIWTQEIYVRRNVDIYFFSRNDDWDIV